MTMFVETILQAKGTLVHTLPETASLAEAVARLNAHNISALVITGAGDAVVGILSEHDIVRRLIGDPTTLLAKPIGAVMSRGVLTCARDTSVAEIMDLMTKRRVRHLPVMDGDQLVGIVSIGDVVKAKIEEIEHDADSLREYIAS
jgi:CBS domain-containing protein